ncbi:hypothetical protein [Microbacterium suwonense]|uniref:hypothetical protein n=1 Tax=Microbacterium suwonense TaxID=683047 RepID=UPI0025746175|nr:hypothetical protein [Microbacterium suwonense]
MTRLMIMPSATPIRMNPRNSETGASELPNSMIAESTRPISTPLIAPERAAAA